VKLEQEFRVSVPVAEVWACLTDLPRVAKSLPGAELVGPEGDAWRGRVRVKVGPITAQYEGLAKFLELDVAAHRARIEAKGRDTKGQGGASAAIVAQLTEEASGTRVAVETDLSITGRLAQIGRGLISDVSAKLMAEFAANLERELLSGGAKPAAAAPGERPEAASPSAPSAAVAAPSSSQAPARAGAASAPAAPVDLLAVAGAPLARRLTPLLAIVALLAALAFWLSR
jgi:carbon monoxide dehydrogenase subunit G